MLGQTSVSMPVHCGLQVSREESFRLSHCLVHSLLFNSQQLLILSGMSRWRRSGRKTAWSPFRSLKSSVLSSTAQNHSANSLTKTIGTEQAAIRRMDDVIDPSAGTAVKIDVQGFEDQVVAGGMSVLNEAPIVEMEMTLTPLYQGQWLIRDALAAMAELGFELALTENIMLDRVSGRSLQINGIFVKSA